MGERRGNDISSKYDYRGGGLIIGFDGKVSERLLLGAAAGSLSTFSGRGDRAQRDSATVGAGVNWEIGKSFSFALAYDATFADDRTEHGGTAGIRYRW